MKSDLFFSRRDFLAGMAAAASTITLRTAVAATGEPPSAKCFKMVGFTKPFQQLSFAETADVVAQVGWDGIECPVRQKGQILPERVEDDLPRLVEALKKRNLELSIVATDVRNITDPLTERVLRAASKSGIKLYRLAHLTYNRDRSIPEQLSNLRAELRDLSAINKELGLCAACQNHSGPNSIGGPVWDIYELFKDSDPKYFGVCFDIGHATIEGGSAWPTNFRLIQPFLKSVFVKDFVWQKTAAAWTAQWRPLGEGMVSPSFFKTLKDSSFSGPIVQHHEYSVGRGTEMIQFMKKDLEVLKSRLAV